MHDLADLLFTAHNIASRYSTELLAWGPINAIHKDRLFLSIHKYLVILWTHKM